MLTLGIRHSSDEKIVFLPIIEMGTVPSLSFKVAQLIV